MMTISMMNRITFTPKNQVTVSLILDFDDDYEEPPQEKLEYTIMDEILNL